MSTPIKTEEKSVTRQVVAMSGGVDSSVAAALLAEAGHDVVGVTLNLAGDTSRCCSLDDVEDARRVAEELGIRFFVANYTERFQAESHRGFCRQLPRGADADSLRGLQQKLQVRLPHGESLGLRG